MKEFDVAYFTASCDKADVNKKFAESLELDYAILSDPSRKIATAYGVVNESRKVPFRYTFYIGENGKILYIDTKVKAATHGEAIAAKLKELGIEKSS